MSREVAIIKRRLQVNPLALRKWEAPVFLNSNGYGISYLALGKLDEVCPDSQHFFELQHFHDERKDWLFGFLSYDLKNQTEQLTSSNQDELEFPDLSFVVPELVLEIHSEEVRIHFHPIHSDPRQFHQVLDELERAEETSLGEIGKPQALISREEYLNSVRGLQEEIRLGNIYEVNLCQEFYSKKVLVDPFLLYKRLNKLSPTPFSVFLGKGDHFLLCASPECYIKKEGVKITSQPIKGTIRRGEDQKEDEALKMRLFESPKDRNENVMIVDLVRNDLSRTAAKGSVKVKELYGIYTFPQVHQMISTVESELNESSTFTDVIRESFPMGSMTGAPKVRAMKLIEEYESFRRGLFSGAVGYITPEGDFDFNVVIRSIFYNAAKKHLSFAVGGAITNKSIPEEEYEESLLKAKAIFSILNAERKAN